MKHGLQFLTSFEEEIVDITDLLSSKWLVSYISYNLMTFTFSKELYSLLFYQSPEWFLLC